MPIGVAAHAGPGAVVPGDRQERQPFRHRAVGGIGARGDPRRAAAAGYDENIVAQLGGHSLRAGFVTQSFRNGADAHAIMRQTGHATPTMVELYAREHAPLVGNAVTEIGL